MQLTSLVILVILQISTFFLRLNGEKEESANIFFNREVVAEKLFLNQREGLVYEGDILFTGISVSSYPNGEVAEKVTYFHGKRNGFRRKWFENRTLSFEAFYKSNKLNGEVKTWWSNGILRSESHFEKGKANGLQKQWYSTGKIFKELNMVFGKEEGIQKAWRENGKIYVNYEAKNGRIFGLKRANLCFELSEENIVIND
ncbi:MAG: toxin-antitoxin system YwqK family antitoxin [Flammeovirgaceae bacterium]|nr:toxin-antitoxin system YwqK family antitoxin [Flammeovirgaceae bacterium]